MAEAPQTNTSNTKNIMDNATYTRIIQLTVDRNLELEAQVKQLQEEKAALLQQLLQHPKKKVVVVMEEEEEEEKKEKPKKKKQKKRAREEDKDGESSSKKKKIKKNKKKEQQQPAEEEDADATDYEGGGGEEAEEEEAKKMHPTLLARKWNVDRTTILKGPEYVDSSEQVAIHGSSEEASAAVIITDARLVILRRMQAMSSKEFVFISPRSGIWPSDPRQILVIFFSFFFLTCV